jgi:Fe-S oxidoreductase
MVTREEKHSTRGRAHLLFEMLQGDVIRDGWRSEEVKEALDLCLACKGCKGECPVNVDMATYKAEFLAHYHQHHLRPREAYAMGWIHRWARLAALAPRVANFFSQTPGMSGLLKFAGGIAQQRQMPAFATETFRAWYSRRAPRNLGGEQIMLWPDTFNNYFHPEVGKAAVEVLEHAGYHVTIPDQVLCCGRPLYDYGMLDEAEHLLRQVLDNLRPQIRAGVPLIGLEPSCLATFRDELHNLFPHDEDAQRLKQQAFMFSEFLNHKADGYQPPRLNRKALLHGHCHHKAVLKFSDEWELLRKAGVDFDMPDSGCCGMAGSFGFSDKHYDISIACGERVLLPAVREAGDETLIIADGFSCQEQIEQTTNRRALHVAEVLQLAIHHGESGPPGPFPERAARGQAPQSGDGALQKTLLVGAGAVLVGGLAAWGLCAARRR